MWGELSYVLAILISKTVLLIYIIMNTTVSHTFVNNDWEKKLTVGNLHDSFRIENLSLEEF